MVNKYYADRLRTDITYELNNLKTMIEDEIMYNDEFFQDDTKEEKSVGIDTADYIIKMIEKRIAQVRDMQGKTLMETYKAIDLIENLIGMIEDNQGNDYDGAFVKAVEVMVKFDKIQQIVGNPRSGNGVKVHEIKEVLNGNDLPHCQHTDTEITKSFVEDAEAVKDQLSTTKNDLGVDAVSRKAVLNQIFYSTDNNGDVVLGSALRERIARLPSITPQEPNIRHCFGCKYSKDNHNQAIEECHLCMWENQFTPQEPKTGHWITKPHVYGATYCSECDFELKIDDTNYCPNCGAKMAESEDA